MQLLASVRHQSERHSLRYLISLFLHFVLEAEGSLGWGSPLVSIQLVWTVIWIGHFMKLRVVSETPVVPLD